MRVRNRYARAEKLTRLVLDALADAHGLDEYWFAFPISQGDLKSSDLLRGGCVPHAVLERVSDALKEGK
jgi:hypothetical protein